MNGTYVFVPLAVREGRYAAKGEPRFFATENWRVVGDFVARSSSLLALESVERHPALGLPIGIATTARGAKYGVWRAE
jgi:hypothetical protein